MRSVSGARKYSDSPHNNALNGYGSSSEDDEQTRLKKPVSTSSGGSDSIPAPAPPSTGKKQRNRRQMPEDMSNHGPESPNGSENTYAEANLLPGSNALRPYEQDYDSEIYANGDPLSIGSSSNEGRYQHLPPQGHRSPTLFPGHGQQRYAALSSTVGVRPHLHQVDNKSPFLSSSSNSTTRTNGRSSGSSGSSRRGCGPTDNTTGRRGHIILTDQGWGQSPYGVSGTMLETRLDRDGSEVATMDYLKYSTQPHHNNSSGMAKIRQNHKGTLLIPQHRRSLSDDSMDKPLDSSNQGMVDPVVMPGFPVRTLQGHPPPPYSPSREKFLLGKRCRFHCSWKMVALALTVLTLILSSVIAYFGAVTFPSSPTAAVQQPLMPPASEIATSDCLPVGASSSSSSSSSSPSSPPGANIGDSQNTDPKISLPPARSPAKAPAIVHDLVPGQWYTSRIEPMSFWRSRLTVPKSNAFYQMNLTFVGHSGGGSVSQLAGTTNVAVYGRRGHLPSVTTYDWAHVVTENGEQRKVAKRSIGSTASFSGGVVSIEKSLTRGDWFFAVLNDNEVEARTLRAVIAPRPPKWTLDTSENAIPGLSSSGSGCPNGCSGKGKCLPNGVCQCPAQFSGKDCSISVCPVLCNGHGYYGGGKCHCEDDWKGPECEIHAEECLVPDCNGHGNCREGVCLCDRGWTGQSCDERHCLDPSCSDHGVCKDAHCHCDLGWMGKNCEFKNKALEQCLPDCSGHGQFDQELGRCDCHNHWSGRDCNITVCNKDCGAKGRCEVDRCVCLPGWSGHTCQIRTCDARCQTHGTCENGTCVCHPGWNGRHCTIEACGVRGDCSSHGQCQQDPISQDYKCLCGDGWTGDFCQFAEEQQCEDGIDNDANGLTDCADSKCCSHPSCVSSVMCVYLADPVEVLLRKPPPSVSASFFQKVQFLFEGDESVQSYVKRGTFHEKRVSIIRGQVVTANGQGIIGVRVSVKGSRDANHYGFTLTRPGGWFDMAVNGGGAVTLQFQRSPLNAATRSTHLPWNEITVLNPIVMTPSANGEISHDFNLDDVPAKIHYTKPCLDHDYQTLKPLVLSSYIPNLSVGSRADETQAGTRMLAETRDLEERIQIPGSRVHLVYRSSSAPGAHATLDIQLTPEKIPESLIRVFLVIRISGRVFRETFEADPDLTFTYAWDKRNVYNQKVYGVVGAKVSVGYFYQKCQFPIWTSQTTRLRGFDVDISDIAKGWNLDTHHHYNSEQGLFQKGDGHWIEFKSFPRVISTTMGTGLKRAAVNCGSDCDGLAKKLDLLNIVSMTTSPDGSIYVGDFNLIRKIGTDGTVQTILQFGASQGSYHYDLKISPLDGRLYITHAERRQILRILDESDSSLDNVEVVVGNGLRCIPGDQDDCGDNGPALNARLNYPKGLAIAMDGTMYISDSRNIRVVMPNGNINTLIGHNGPQSGPPRPLACSLAFLVQDVQLQWPTKLELNPLDNSLHIVDDTMVLRLTTDMRVEVIAGLSPSCNKDLNQTKADPNGALFLSAPANRRIFGPLIDLAFGPSGQLFLAEKQPNPQRNVIHIIDFHGQVRAFAGQSNPQASGVKNVTNYHDIKSSLNSVLADQISFNQLSAIALSPDNTLHVADNGALKIYSLKESQPLVNTTSGNVLISDPIAREIYTFNRYGQHVSTHSLETGAKLLSFIYSKNTAFGRLTVMLDALGNKISLQRDYTNRVQSIENTHGQKHALRLSRMGYLEVFNQDERNAISLSYEENSGLVTSKTHTNGDFFVYEFDSFGRLGRVVLPSGESFQMTSRICPQAATQNLAASCVEIQRNHRTQMRIATHQSGRVQILNPNEEPFPVFLGEDEEALSSSIPTCQPLSILNLPYFTSEMTSSTCLGQQPIRLSLGPSSADIGPPTLLQIDPLLHDLQQRSALQQNLVLFDSKYPHWNPLRLNWKFNQRESGSPTNRMTTWYSLEHGKSMEDISRALMIDGHEQILGVHYDPKTQEETFLNGHGQVLMTVEYINGILPKGWSDQQGHNCTWNYDRIHRPSQLNCDGRQIESKAYDQRNGRISQSQTCQQRAAKKFNYGTNANMPRDVILPSGRIFSYEYDQTGGLAKIILPAVSTPGQSDTSPEILTSSHTFSLQFGFGHVKLYHQPPGSMEPFVVYWHESDGKIMKIRPPGNNGLRLFQYSTDGRLRAVISGQEQTTFEYGPKAYASKIEHRVDDGDFSMSETELEEIRVKELEVGQRHQQQRVVLQEKRIMFGAETALAGGKFEYEYALNWNEPIIQGRIGAQALPEVFVWHIWGLSAKHSRRQIGQFFLQMHHLNETSITDAVASFRRTTTSENLVVNGKQVYSADLSFDPCHPAKVESASIRLQRETGEFNRILGFVYDDDGQLFKVSDANGFRDNWEWQYTYDTLGNLVSISASTSSSMVKHALFYDEFNRIARLDGSFFRYDDLGRITTNQNGHALLFNARNLLIKAETIKGIQVTLNYDYKGRLVSRSDNLGNVTQYFYAHREKDHLVTHAYRPREGVLSSLLYDNQDRLIFAQVGQKSLYIVSDWNGSPFLYVSPTGQIVNEIRRSPYGQIISETTSGWDEDRDQDHIYSALLPLGFRGGLFDPELGLVHMQDPSGSRPYDPETGTFLTPMAWNEILNRQNIFDPTHWQSLYRFPGNDPINSRSNSILTDPNEARNFIQNHLHNAFPTLDEDNIHRLIHSRTNEKPNQRLKPFQHLSWPTFSLTIGAEQQFRAVHASFHRLGAVRPSPLISQPEMQDLALEIARAGSALGKYVVLSREGRDRVRIHACPKKANDVTADVFTTVLNEATLVDFTMVSHVGEDSYFFVKNPIWKSSEDIVQLRRLGPKEVNLTMHESQTDNSKILDVKVHLTNTVINVRYGTLAEVEKMRLLRHSLKTMTRKAWIHERDSLSKQSSNFPPFVSGHKPWSDRERSQILNKGFAEGYDVTYKRDVRQYPELANDLENVQFVRKA